MATKAQRDYYTMPAAGEVLDARLDAIAQVMPKGATVLDLGCNDGSVSNGLLERGAIAKSFGFDLEDIIAHRRPEIVFQAADMKTFDLAALPDADGVLILNLLHHLVGFSKERAKEVIDALIARYPFVIIDMGSFTENGDWYWRRAYTKNWKSDAEMWSFLFSSAKWRFKLLRYPTQGKGQRTLWKLYRDPYPLGALETVETFKRVPGTWALTKKLIPVAQVGETVIVNSVEFSLARSAQGDKFWIKRYLGSHAELRARIERELGHLASQEAMLINQRARRDLRAVEPVAVEGGVLTFLFEPELFAGEIVHFQDWADFFTPEQCKAGSVLGSRAVPAVAGLQPMKLISACDFQICVTWDGISALDFEPYNWLTQLRARA
jgi:SAM-dependent methyltransferase